MSGHILVTAATGKTGRRLMANLRALGSPAVGASRRAGAGLVRFDWTDLGTWDDALNGVDSAYLVAPSGVGDPADIMIEFTERAIARGVVRFVLLSASLLDSGGPAMGQVHHWLAKSGVEWAVLRPSWFMENLSEGPHCLTIRDEHAIYTAAGNGRVPFISTDDVAGAAAVALTTEQAANCDFILTGPEALTYQQVAERISTATGQTITHFPLTFEELVARHVANGLTDEHAQTLAFMDLAIAGGAEDRVTQDLGQLTPGFPVSFEAFVAAHVRLWSKT
ncbi:MAG TPA: NAD(P)H-binding protein [Mycobacteriales bacterium]|nr:NAD(P)H-binding protein [Mycobacteriales bacterium]